MTERMVAARQDFRGIAMAIGSFDEFAKERLSALADGELDGNDPAGDCALWGGNADARRDWHAWHLIGDVLRSDDLASAPAHDRQLCAAIRARLREEPVVLAPSATVRAPSRWSWPVGAATAAGLALVVGTIVVLRPAEPPAAPSLAAAAPAVSPTVVAAATPAATVVPASLESEPVVADIRLIRDAQLDRYLAAHKQFAGSSALGVPSAFLRGATVDAPASR